MSKENNQVPAPAEINMMPPDRVMQAWVEMMKHNQVPVWLKMSPVEIGELKRRIKEGKPPGEDKKYVANYIQVIEGLLAGNSPDSTHDST